MTLRIEEISPANQHELNRVDGTFTIDSVLDVKATGYGDKLCFIPVTPYEKRYPLDTFDIPKYITATDKIVYFAYVDHVLAGQIVLRRNWNRCAYIEDIAVDRSFRRRGIGKSLVDVARDWTAKQGLPAIMLETQNNNPGACRFYHAYGFKIGGYDQYLYVSLNPKTTEIALFWYYFL